MAADAGATAMTDVSDGLVADLAPHRDVRPVSESTCRRDALAADRDARWQRPRPLAMDPWSWVLGGGEDHALVATFPGRATGRLAGDRHGARRRQPRVLVDGERLAREIRAGSRSDPDAR